MAYDKKTQTITVGPSSDFLADFGAFSLNVMRDLAQEPNTSVAFKSDWAIIEDWLKCAGRELTQEDHDKYGRAWQAYYSIGLAPSFALQDHFTEISKKYKSRGQSFLNDMPPGKVLQVFDRTLATEDEIRIKRGADRAALKANQEKALKAQSSPPHASSWWRRQPQSFRAWIFISIAWATAAYFYIAVFDPFELDDWRWAEDKDYLKAISIIAAPLIFGIVKRSYDCFVK